ncbi:YhfG family protein [Yersinia bercovieri]|uniref:YhfG family protein n=1 Tax=Yersinia bercovieri TaxID=634 RepID=UPI0021BD57DF|nr:YhfG family protein [Yersinia bercovieri]
MANVMTSLAEKKQYFDRVKLENYRQSMRLEGLNSTNQTLPTSKNERAKLKQSLMSKYAAKNQPSSR